MLAFEVKLNGKRICVAGMKDLAILNAGVTAAGPLGEKTVKVRPDEDREIFYSVSGLTGRRDPDTDVHVRWRSIEHIQVGDVLQIKVVETDQVDRPRSRKRRKRSTSLPES